MSQQDPNQPQQPGYAQQPGQPGGPQWGQQPGPYGQPGYWAPQPPKKKHTGRNIGIGCGGLVGLVVIIGIIAAIAGGGSDRNDTATASTGHTTAPANAPSAGDGKASPSKAAAPAKPKKPDVVTFKVWGNAPASDLGPLTVDYGSDNDQRQGNFKNGSFTMTLPYSSKANVYMVDTTLMGSGDIHCSVTVKGKTKTAQAHGGYAGCDASLTNILGSWS